MDKAISLYSCDLVSIDKLITIDKKAHKKISVYLIKEDEKFYEIEAEKKAS